MDFWIESSESEVRSRVKENKGAHLPPPYRAVFRLSAGVQYLASGPLFSDS